MATTAVPVSRSTQATSAEREHVEELLTDGDLTVDGLLVESSNHAMVGEVRRGDDAIRCVYKPLRGERPLWDFPRGELARREVAAYRLATLAGWDCVPPTVFRDGPAGPGMVQQWVTEAADDAVARIFTPEAVPDGWLPIFRAEDEDGRPLVVAHADTLALQTFAVFDAVANNADRKASHLLTGPAGVVLGVDHGLTFHREPKLRTILWGWAGEPIPESILGGLDGIEDALPDAMADYLDDAEIDALLARIDTLRQRPTFPQPPADRHAIPWPPL